MNRRASIITVEGFQKSYVTLKEAIKKVGLNTPDSGVTTVDELLDSGEQGKVYYNTTDNKYYIYNGEEFKEFGVTNPPIINVTGENIMSDDLIVGVKYTLTPNAYCNLGSVAFNDLVEGVVIDIEPSTTEALSYTGRFTVGSVSTNTFTFPSDSGIIIPDEQAEKLADLEAGHTYEFNIFANVFMISDITATE